MCHKWIRQANENNQAIDVCIFFDNFLSDRPGYQFTVAQIFSGLHEIGITYQQYAEIENHLGNVCKFALPDKPTSELLKEGSIEMLSFDNLTEFQRFQDKELVIKNRPIVDKMYKKVNQHYDRMKDVFAQFGDKGIMAFDIQADDLSSCKNLEIGYTMVRFSSDQTKESDRPIIEVISKRHFIIKESLDFKSSDGRSRFRFGFSETVSLLEVLEMFRVELGKCDFLLGHSIENNDEYLRKRGLDLSKMKKEMFDTQLIQMAKEMEPRDVHYTMPSLKFLLQKYNVKYEEEDLYNAGCCACYIMMVFLCQAGSPIDTVDTLLNLFLE